jgi:hypothetical protein
LAKEITEQERSAMARIHAAIRADDQRELDRAERAALEVARSTGASEVWEAWAFLSAETATAVDEALRRERELITQRLEALYADPSATWDDILAVARPRYDDAETSAA